MYNNFIYIIIEKKLHTCIIPCNTTLVWHSHIDFIIEQIYKKTTQNVSSQLRSLTKITQILTHLALA